jgi:hypothetical protein
MAKIGGHSSASIGLLRLRWTCGIRRSTCRRISVHSIQLSFQLNQFLKFLRRGQWGATIRCQLCGAAAAGGRNGPRRRFLSTALQQDDEEPGVPWN